MEITEKVQELWRKYPVAVIAVVGGGVLLVLAYLGKKNSSDMLAPGVDTQPVTYQIYGSSGGVSGGGGGAVPSNPNPPAPAECPPGYHRATLSGECTPDLVSPVSPHPGPVPIIPGPPPIRPEDPPNPPVPTPCGPGPGQSPCPSPNPFPEIHCQAGYHPDPNGNCVPDRDDAFVGVTQSMSLFG